ncbi:LuxR family transcriptional regulator [Actinomadura viridis]|uniref:DNA-binding CsgD family transcriptional regulator n=1 Tax=Actinomadura viridis TaxID=58110 RepID=A0A931DLP3_9ACTN|nr:LuxR family transcriptional regulator [Actinomadura viridis]MBG6091807.1 DNA-binding CsgD family transcriptional regulator [Actinomadura viridis]
MPPRDPPLVEREVDLASLVAALARPPAVVVVEGERGAGKTRLVREALAAPGLEGRQPLVGHSRPTLASCPLGPVIEALATASRPPVRPLSALAGVLRTVLPELAAILPPAPPPVPEPQLVRHRLVRASAELLAKLGPTILVLEDVQWGDAATVELIRMIGARPPPELSIVITCEPPAALPELGLGTTRLSIPPLSPAGAGRLACAILGDPETVLPTGVADLLYERSGGVPFVVREDVRMLRQHDLLRPVNGAWTLGPGAETAVPPAVGAMIAARLRSLDATGTAVLEAAAVLAGSAEPELVARVAGLSTGRTCAALGDAMRRGLLRDHGPDGGTVRFRHELARLAVYESVPGYRRRGLHAIAAQVLTAAGGALRVRAVDHHRRAGDLRAWAASAEAAAEAALAAGAFGTAHSWLRDVLQAGAVAPERRAEVAVKLGRAALGAADPGGTTSGLLAEVAEAASPEQRAELLLLRLWSALESDGPADGAATALRDALGGLVRRPGLRAIAHALLATPTRLPGLDLAAQKAHLDRARTALTETGDPMAHAVVRTATAHLLLATGGPEGWAAARAVPVHGDRPEIERRLARGLLDLAESALHLGHYTRGLDLAERARRPASGAPSPAFDTRLRAVVARIRWTTGDCGAEDDVGVLSGDPFASGLPNLRLLSAQIDAGQGRLDAARRTLRAVAEEACETGDLAVAAQAAAEFNRVALTLEQRRLGHALARQVLDGVARKGVWVWAAPLLPFAPLDLVREVLPRYRGAVADRDAPLARAALGFAEARMSERYGDAGWAAAGYRRARRGYAVLPDPRLAAHACAGEARARISAGQVPDAEPLRHAWSTFTGLGAVWDANRLKQTMRAAGLPVPHRRGRPGYGNQLSPREREIAVLAASGHTNRDIAAGLYLSDRTVKYHLANAMRKLGVSSRRQLGDVLEPADRSDHTCRCGRCGRELNLS